MVALTITGRRVPELLEERLDAEDRGLAVERVEDRLDQQDVRAAGDEAARRGRVGRRRAASQVTLRAPESLTSGEIEAVLFVGPSDPATKRGLSGVCAVAASAAARAIAAAPR